MLKKSALLLGILTTLLCSCKVSAVDIRMVNPLNFGIIAIRDNSKPQFIDMSFTGIINFSTGIRFIERGSVGNAEVYTDLKHILLFINTRIIQSETTSTHLSQEQLALTNIYTPSSIYTAYGGVTDIPIGGRIETSGSGSTFYPGEDYTGVFEITVNF